VRANADARRVRPDRRPRILSLVLRLASGRTRNGRGRHVHRRQLPARGRGRRARRHCGGTRLHIAFGLFAVAIGFLVGQGTVRFSGGKRTAGLQALSVGVALLSYVGATYLVNMTFINQALAKQGETFRVGFPPASLGLLFRVVTVDFGMMDLVFLAIVVWEAWKIPRAIALPPEVTA
jgi:hypothetical protein